MSELRRFEAVNPYEQPSESEHGKYYLADDVDKRIEELKQRIKELADNLEEAEDLHAEWVNEVAPKISELKQRIEELEARLKEYKKWEKSIHSEFDPTKSPMEVQLAEHYELLEAVIVNHDYQPPSFNDAMEQRLKYEIVLDKIRKVVASE